MTFATPHALLCAERDGDKPWQGVVANTVNVLRGGAVGFIDWLDAFIRHSSNESGKTILPFLSNPKVTPDEPPCPSVANPA